MKAFGWACILGVVCLGAACDEPQGEEKLGEARQALTTNERILGFERVSATPSESDWLTTGGSLSSASPATEGAHALGIANIGWAQLESSPLSALGSVSTSLKLDVRIPGSGTVPWGDVQVFLNSPQLAIWNEPVGQRLLGGSPAGSFQTIELSLSSALVTKLSSSGYNDLVVRIALNLPQNAAATLVDNLRFSAAGSGSGGTSGTGSGGSSSSGGSASSGSSNASGSTSGGSSSGGGGSTGAGTAGTGGSATSGAGGADVGPCVLGSVGPTAATPYAFSIKLPAGVSRSGVAIGATSGKFYVNDGVKLLGGPAGHASATSVLATADVRVGVGVELLDVYNDRAIAIANSAHIFDSAFAGTNVDRQTGSTVDGLVRELYDAAPLQSIDWSVGFPNLHRGSCSLEPGASQQLRPAAYGNISVKSGSSLKLTPGTYFFESLTLAPGSSLELTNSDGIVIYVRGAFSFEGSVHETADRGNVMFAVAGTSGAYIGSAFRGVVIAPNGPVDLATTTAGHVGQFFGKVVTAHQHTNITLRAYESGSVCGEASSCGAFCPCTSGGSCNTSADCAEGLVCPRGNGPRHGLARGTSVCEPSGCLFQRRDLGCGFPGATCGNSCDDGVACQASSDCPSGEVCASGAGARVDSDAPAVCMPTSCVDEPVTTNCGSTVELCGKCSCTSTCGTKQCGDSPIDACGNRCRGFCGPRDSGCTSDADCQEGLSCIVGGGPRIGLGEGVNVCLPRECASPNPLQQPCENIGSPCGICPPLGDVCGDRTCGTDPSHGTSCGSAPPSGSDCVQGLPIGALDDTDLVIDTTNRDTGGTVTLQPLPVTEVATESAPGALDGSFDVSERGTANYTIPIVVPPGRSGIEPRLSLKYEGGQANGAVGVGWSVSGLSSIARCPKIAAIDGWGEPVQYDTTDPVCLDGQRLKVVEGSAWVPGSVFRAELDGLDQVTLLTDSADGRPYFEVRKRDGRIYSYGYDANSRLYRDKLNEVVRVWALSRIEDRVGNLASFEYGKFESAEARQLTDVHGEPIVDVENQTVEFFLKSVAYGGIKNGLVDIPSRRLVELEYDPFRLDYMDGSTRGGARVARTQLLKSITTSIGRAKVRSYELSYEGVHIPGPLEAIIANDQKTRRLKQVTECGHKHGSRVCKRPTVFDYTDEYGLDASPHVTPFPQLKPEGPRSIIKLDWNGDGREDLLVEKSQVLNRPNPDADWTLLVATGNRSGAAFVEAPLASLKGPVGERPGCINQSSVVDFNHDGKDDLVSFCGAERLHKKWFSNGDLAAPFRPIDGWDTPLGAPARMLLVDLDADGFMDLFTCADDNVVRSRHNIEGKLQQEHIGVIASADRWGTCFDFSKQIPDDPLMVQDVDGDGYGEVLMYRKPTQAALGGSLVNQSLWARYVVTQGGDSAHWQQIWLPLTERAYRDGAYRFVDLNGDGLKDLVYLDRAQSDTPLLSLNHAGTFGAPRAAYTGWDSYPNGRSRLAATVYSLRSALPVDYDGDGGQDLLRRFDQQAANAPVSSTSLWQWDRSEHQLDKYAGLWGDSTTSPPSEPFRLMSQPGAVPPQRGREVPALLADVDADGSPDLVQLDENGSVYVSYGHFGRESLLKAVTDGLGKRVEVSYDAHRTTLNGLPERVYQPAAVCHTIEQSPRTRCLRNPGPLVSEIRVAYDIGGGQYRVDTKTRLRYEDAREGLWGRGFYGFGKRFADELTADDSLISSTELKYEVFPKTILADQLAPFAGRELERTVYTPAAESSLEAQRAQARVKRINDWWHRTSALGGPLVFLEGSIQQVDELLPSGSVPMTETRTSSNLDEYGNVDLSTREVRRAGIVISTQTSLATFDKSPTRVAEWLISLPRVRSVSDRVYNGSEEPYVARTIGYAYDDLGLIKQVVREPDADVSSGMRQVTDFTRLGSDPFHRVQSITRSGTWLDDGDEVSQARQTTLEYDDDVIFLKRTRSKVRCSPSGSDCSELVTDVRFDPRDGTLLGTVDPAGVGTLVGYDSFGRVLKEVRASGTTTVDYQDEQPLVANGRLVPAKLKVSTKNLATGAASIARLDALGRAVQVSRTAFKQESLLQEFEFAWGNLVTYASRPHLPGDATQGAVTQSYDDRWRLERRSFPDGTYVELGSASAENANVGYEAGELRVRSVRDQRGNLSYAFTDFRGDTLRTVDELGHSTRYRYDPFSTLATVTDSIGHVTRLRADALGRLVEHEDADTGLQTYRYTTFDETLRVTEEGDSEERERTYHYDELGRLITLVAPEGPTSFAYDGPGVNAEGKLVETSSPSGAVERYEYQPRPADGDPMKNLGFVEHVSRQIDGTTYTTHLGYDPTKHLLERIDYPESGAGQPFAVRYGYDSFGNLETVTGTSQDGSTDNANLWTLNAAYQGQAIAQETFGNGATTGYDYYASTGRLKRLTTRDSSNVVLQDINYSTYDGNGNLKARSTTVKRLGMAGADTYTETFNYDALDRLDDYTTNGAVTDLRYDDLGNITFKTGVGDYAYVEDGKTYRPHAVVGISSGTTKVADYRYDDFGNLSHRSGDGVVGGTQDITYTSFNKPATVTLGSGASASHIRYEYDAAQQRVLVAVGNCESEGDPSCNKRVYVGGGYERQTSTEAGVRVTRHSYKVFAGSRQIAQIEREQRQGATVETRRFIHADHLGSSQLFTDSSGQLVHAQRFDPFGATSGPAPTPDSTSARIRAGFTGHETDVETGLVNMGGRLYDSRIGRVLQADPPFMESPFWSQGLNRYSYVFNNPLNLVDPTGHQASDDDDVDIEEQELPTIEIVGTRGGAGAHDADDDEKETSPSEDPDDDEDASDYEETESVSATNSGRVPEIPSILDHLGGFGLGYAQGIVPGGTFLPIPPGSKSYQLAVALGQAIGGLEDIKNGLLLAGGGTLATETVVAAPVSVPVAAAGFGLATAGSVNLGNALGNIIRITSDDGTPPAASEMPKAGETPATAAGRAAHKAWKPPPGFQKEVRLPSGRRADAVNTATREVIELKPNNPRAIREGQRQVDRYVQELEEITGEKWTGRVETY